MGRLTKVDKKCILDMRSKGFKPGYISKHKNIPENTIRGFLKRYKKTGSLKDSRVKRGKVTPEIYKFIESFITDTR